MEHAQKVRHLEEARQLRRLGGTAIYPAVNAQGCAMTHFAFTPIPTEAVSQIADADRVAPARLTRTA